MSGIVHFKFKSSNAYDSVSFDGAFVSVGELKTLIAEKKGLSKDATSELQLSDPRTQAEYSDDSAVIPKSSSVLVRRVPSLQSGPARYTGAPQPAKPTGGVAGPSAVQLGSAPAAGADEEFGGELYSEQKDEDAALSQMLAQTGQQWEKEVKAGAIRGRGRGFGRGGFGRGRGREAAPAVLPKGYICYRCGQQGHHISDCPTSADPDAKRIRPAVGVPSVLLAKSAEGGLLLPDGTTGTLQPNEDAFLKEMGLVKPAEPPPASQPPAASQPPPKLEAEPAPASQADDSKALALVSQAEPTLAGSSELPFGAAGPMLPLPGMGVAPWDAGMKLPQLPPGFPLPGLADPLQPAPLSREEFQRMKEQLRRKARSRSTSASRRDRRRDSRSPRRRRSSRQRSRDRSGSRDRRLPPRRRSPSPSFIQLRKRSRSPRPRRQATSRSPPPVVQLRRRDPSSPRASRSRRRDTTRWRPEEDVVQLRAREDSRAAPSSSNAPSMAAADFSVPQLMDEPPASIFDEAPPQDSRAKPRSRRHGDLGASLSRLQRGVGSRWKDDAQDKTEAEAAAVISTRDAQQERAEETHRSASSDRRPSGGPRAPSVEPKGHGPLPKTFSIPLNEPKREKKEKKEKRSKDKKASKRKRSKHSPERSPPPAAIGPGEDIDLDDSHRHQQNGAPEAADAVAIEEPASKKLRGSKSLLSKALAASVDQSSSGVPTTTGGTTTAGGSSDATLVTRGQQLDSSAGQQSEEDVPREGKSRKHKEHKHTHKHSKKKRHREKE